ncbi:hypothetical protein BJF90_17745 [Pseudonocardia sp. CNS-004]|nr:hypothetical protein BJF90_17745 [Pseudonocardia sp. CNS-004]
MQTEGQPRDRITEAGAVIAGWTRLWSRLLVVHVAGPDGRCRGCPSSLHASPRWPCRLAELAGAAQAAHRAQCGSDGSA